MLDSQGRPGAVCICKRRGAGGVEFFSLPLAVQHLKRLLEHDDCEVVMAVLRVLSVLATPRSTRQVCIAFYVRFAYRKQEESLQNAFSRGFRHAFRAKIKRRIGNQEECFLVGLEARRNTWHAECRPVVFWRTACAEQLSPGACFSPGERFQDKAVLFVLFSCRRTREHMCFK